MTDARVYLTEKPILGLGLAYAITNGMHVIATRWRENEFARVLIRPVFDPEPERHFTWFETAQPQASPPFEIGDLVYSASASRELERIPVRRFVKGPTIEEYTTPIVTVGSISLESSLIQDFEQRNRSYWQQLSAVAHGTSKAAQVRDDWRQFLVHFRDRLYHELTRDKP